VHVKGAPRRCYSGYLKNIHVPVCVLKPLDLNSGHFLKSSLLFTFTYARVILHLSLLRSELSLEERNSVFLTSFPVDDVRIHASKQTKKHGLVLYSLLTMEQSPS